MPEWKPRFTIGQETTYVTGPVDKYGYIDYATALNERLRRGVTPQNNANVLLWRALGLHLNGIKISAQYFRWMEIDPPPKRGDYFIELSAYMRKHAKLDPEAADEIDYLIRRTTTRAWTPKQYPHIAAWLKANEKPLALVIEATKRPEWFSPLVACGRDRASSAFISLPLVFTESRQVLQALTARAMLRVAQGQIDKAWQDLIACHRLCRLVGRGPMPLEFLVSIALHGIACKGALAFVNRGKLNAKPIEGCLRDLKGLPPLPDVAAKVNRGERFYFLDGVMMMARRGVRSLETLSISRLPKTWAQNARRVWPTIDWDPVMRTGNQWYDRLVAALRIKNRRLREERFRKIDSELESLPGNFNTWSSEVFAKKDPGKQLGRVFADVLIRESISGIPPWRLVGDRAEQTQNNLYIAIALAAYRADHGRYPAKLEMLAPRYLPTIPNDIFSERPPIYRVAKDGYLLYSVGANGQDDGGRGPHDDPPGDDLSVRMPLPALKK